MELSKYDKVSVRFYWDNPMTIDQMTDLVYDFLVDLEAISPALSGWMTTPGWRIALRLKRF